MTTNLTDFPLQAWKQQLDAALRAAEAVAEASIRIREAQLEAAVETHAAAEAARKDLEKAEDLQAVWRIQGEWLTSSMQKTFAYWRSLYEAASQAPSPAAGKNLVETMDSAYKSWLETTQQFYSLPSVSLPAVSVPKDRKAA